MQRYWFKPKRYGLGAAPSSWQGWALVLVYVAAISAVSVWFADAETRLQSFLIITAVITIVFLGVCWRTTEGGWRWRWGKD